jgi:hypothetical protein
MSDFDLIRWDTPFADTLYPSVIPVPNFPPVLSFAVAPDGIDKYPKYLVRFEAVIAYKCEDESYPPSDRRFDHLSREEERLSTYQWIESPWLKSYSGEVARIEAWHKDAVGVEGAKLRHYVLGGGDTIAEILAVDVPKIKKVDAPRQVMVYEV